MIASCSNTIKVSQQTDPQERLHSVEAWCMVKTPPATKQLETGTPNGDMLATLTYNNYLWKQDRLKVECLQNYVLVIQKDQKQLSDIQNNKPTQTTK